MSTLVFLVLAEFPPGVSILLFSGVFISQTLISMFDNDVCCSFTPEYTRAATDEMDHSKNRCTALSSGFCSIVSKLLAFVLQLTGLLGLVGYFVYKTLVKSEPIEYRVVVGMPLAVLALSIVWSNRCQEFIVRSSIPNVPARYKSGGYIYRIHDSYEGNCVRELISNFGDPTGDQDLNSCQFEHSIKQGNHKPYTVKNRVYIYTSISMSFYTLRVLVLGRNRSNTTPHF